MNWDTMDNLEEDESSEEFIVLAHVCMMHNSISKAEIKKYVLEEVKDLTCDDLVLMSKILYEENERLHDKVASRKEAYKL